MKENTTTFCWFPLPTCSITVNGGLARPRFEIFESEQLLIVLSFYKGLGVSSSDQFIGNLSMQIIKRARPRHNDCLILIVYTAVLRKVVPQKCISVRDNVEW